MEGGLHLFSQSSYECKVEWGRRGAREAAERGDIVIIVDVLSFSSTVVSALKYEALIYPYPPHLDGKEYASSLGAEYILGRAESSKIGKPTLSPVTFNPEHANKKYVLSSMNGSFCTWIASKIPALLIGCLLNAASVAHAANQLKSETKANITVVPCGEQWESVRENEDSLRPSMEDYLGAGAILANLQGSQSPEAIICAGAFKSVKQRVDTLMWESGSGRELRNRGYGDDVKHCTRLNVYETVPILHSNHFIPL